MPVQRYQISYIRIQTYFGYYFLGGKTVSMSRKTNKNLEDFMEESVIVIQPAIKNETVVAGVAYYEELRMFEKFSFFCAFTCNKT